VCMQQSGALQMLLLQMMMLQMLLLLHVKLA
jgi:hypothetical protein